MGTPVEDGPAPSVMTHRCSSAIISSLVLGQLISLLTTGTGVFTALLTADGIDIPAVQSCINYLLLCLHFLGSLMLDFRAIKIESAQQQEVPTWRYLLWAFCDVEANYLVILAYQYTSVASVFLLDCFAIPCTLMVSRAVFGAKYSGGHISACLLCVLGLSLTVLSDALAGEAAPTPRGPAWLGDLLVLASATLYSCSNVQQESIMKTIGSSRRTEALGKLGIWGALFAGINIVVLEQHAVASCVWTPRNLLFLLGFQLCLFCMYVLTSALLLRSDAMLFNLSLLTSDVYSVAFTWKVQHQHFSWLYASAFGTTLSGVIVYTLQPSPAEHSEAVQNGSFATPLLGAGKENTVV